MKYFSIFILTFLILGSTSGEAFAQKQKKEKKIYTYVSGQFDTVNESSAIIDEIQLIVKNTKKKKRRNQYLKQMVFDFLSASSSKDQVMLFLYDTYCQNPRKCKFLDETEQRIVKRKVATKRKLMVGKHLPAFEGSNRDGEYISMDSIKTAYKILWIWDPDCDHCIEMTPELYHFYIENREVLDLEVIAVSVIEDKERWINFIEEYCLGWINLSYAMGDYNYDLIEYLDLIQTPSIYLVDRNNKILAREFHVEELPTIFKKINP